MTSQLVHGPYGSLQTILGYYDLIPEHVPAVIGVTIRRPEAWQTPLVRFRADEHPVGVYLAIGTDGAPSNNRITLLDEMWLASLIHKGPLLEPTVMPGKQADLVVVNPRTPNMLPLHDPIANLVTAMQNRNVESVMCDGRWLMRDGSVLTVDEDVILTEAMDRAAHVVRRAGVWLPPRFGGHPGEAKAV